MHSNDGVGIVYARPASFQIQNVAYVRRVYWTQSKNKNLVLSNELIKVELPP